jgi:hypothetical protein
VTACVPLLAVCLGALVLRLSVLPWIRHPGIADPNHYYNLALRLMEGHGLTIDYIWQYHLPPVGLVHPIDHWMPLTGLLASVPMSLFGPGVCTALIPFVLIGSALPALTHVAARRLGVGAGSALFCATVTAVLPELVLNSVRTDTTIVHGFLLCAGFLLFTQGLSGHRPPASFAGAGAMIGLAYLTRHDATLVFALLLAALLVHVRWSPPDRHPPWRQALLTPSIALLVVLPWLARNSLVLGTPTAPALMEMFFYTAHDDHFAYGRRFGLETMLAHLTRAQLIGKRLFELAAAVKVMYTTLDGFLAVATAGGLALLLLEGRRERWREVAPVLVYLATILIAYPLLIPFKSQAGSFKKAYLAVVPLLVPWAAYAIERAVTNPRIRVGAMALAIAVTGANAVELVRADARFTNAYLDHMTQVARVTRVLPDTTGDGEVILLAQDPFMLRFLGVRSAMIPFESRETILAVARRYGVDYLLMPADRPALESIQRGEADARFPPVRAIPGTTSAFHRLDFGH